MIKYFVKKCILAIFLTCIFSASVSVSVSATPKCELKLDNLNDYKSSLISCLEKDINEFDKKLLNNLSDNKTNFFSKKSFQQQMVEAKKNERANALKEVKRLCTEFGFTAGMLKGSLAEGRSKK